MLTSCRVGWIRTTHKIFGVFVDARTGRNAVSKSDRICAVESTDTMARLLFA